MYACRKTVCTNLKIHVHGKMVNAIPSLPFGFGFRLKHSSLSVSIRVAFLFCCVPMALVFCPFDSINPRRACAARVTVVVLCVCVVCCVFVCPGRSSATHATKRQTRHTHGLSILLAPE